MGCPLGYTKSDHSPVTLSSLPIPSCEQQNIALAQCREAVAKQGTGACPSEALANRACMKARRAALAALEQHCITSATGWKTFEGLQAQFSICVATKDEKACAKPLQDFLKCAQKYADQQG
eukprot:m.84361 g.84361  ORF g.84361 m.84361 type:complete len:121 (+) comp12962_c0_seq2:308-670(+)